MPVSVAFRAPVDVWRIILEMAYCHSLPYCSFLHPARECRRWLLSPMSVDDFRQVSLEAPVLWSCIHVRHTYPEWSLALVQAQVQGSRTHPLAVEIVLEDHGDLLWDCWQVLLPHLHRWKYINIGATYTLYCELIQGMLEREAALPSLEYLELRFDDSINTKPVVLAQLACSCPQVRHLGVLNMPINLPPLLRNTTAPMSMSNLAELSIDNPCFVIELDALAEVLKHLAPTLSTLALACARITCESDFPTFPSLPRLHKLFLANLLSAIVSESVATLYSVRRTTTALPAELEMGCKPDNA